MDKEVLGNIDLEGSIRVYMQNKLDGLVKEYVCSLPGEPITELNNSKDSFLFVLLLKKAKRKFLALNSLETICVILLIGLQNTAI